MFATEFIPLDPIFYNAKIETSLPMSPIVGRPISIHLIRNARLYEIQERTTARRAASHIQNGYVRVVCIEGLQFGVIERNRLNKNRVDLLIRAVEKESPKRITHYAIVCSDLDDTCLLTRAEVCFVKIHQGA